MSYCRWSECDVYAYDSCEGGVRFWVAGDDSLNRLCGTYNEAYQYAKELRDKHGLDVPSFAIDALREDAIDEAERYFGADSAVAERISENAKLRKLLLDVWNDAIRFDGFWDYVMDDGEIYNEDELPHYQERMREMGIEVN